LSGIKTKHPVALPRFSDAASDSGLDYPAAVIGWLKAALPLARGELQIAARETEVPSIRAQSGILSFGQMEYGVKAGRFKLRKFQKCQLMPSKWRLSEILKSQ